MRSVAIQFSVPDRDADAVYRTVADFARYPELSEAVRDVVVTSVEDNVTVSRWEVAFRAGILRWTEEDRMDPARRHIDFRQLEGDIAEFEGSWDCADTDGGATLSFAARLDMGIPTLADALEPIAVHTLVDNTVAIVQGLFAGATVTDVSTPASARVGVAS